jgi:hypothetical protein
MGQIIIETPNRLNRRYQVDKDHVSKLVEFLDSSSIRVDSSEEITTEDRSDISAARKARGEESIGWEEAKALLGV